MPARVLVRLSQLARPAIGIGAAACGAHYLSSRALAQPRNDSPLAANAPAERQLSAAKRAMNMVYDNPFKTIVGVAAPLYGAIFYRESTCPSTRELLLSQRLIHTRVYGQAIAVATTIAVMSFLSMMERRGGAFVAPVASQEEPHTGNLAKAYSTSAENYGRPHRSEAEKAGLLEDDEYGAKTDLLVPLFLVPAIPLMFVVLRNRVPKETLHRIVMGMVGVGLLHAGYIQMQDSSMYNA